MIEIDGSEMPPGEALLFCECGCESPAFCFDANIYGCATCEQVVFPAPLPFVYAPPACYQCARQLTRQNCIPAKWMRPDDCATCPRCNSRSLKLRTFPITLSGYDPGDSTPLPGQLLHARTRQSERGNEPFCFFCPRLIVKLRLSISVANRERDSIPNGHHEFRTVRVADGKLVVDYVRELSEDKWRWYV